MSVTPEEYNRKKQENWNRRSSREYFVVDRAFVDSDDFYNSYEYLLGSHRGLSLSETIETKTRSATPVHIFDAGCGEGTFLLGAKQKWQEKVTASGISAFPYHLDSPTSASAVNSGEICILQGSIDEYTQRDLHDVLTCVYAIMYLFDPLQALQNLYASLRIGGVGFIYPFRVQFENLWEDQILQEYLTEKYDFEWSAARVMSFTREHEKLEIPSEIASIEKRHSASSSWQTVYRLRG